MPNRILKESICTSEDIDRLSPGAEILFYRLMVRADDFGTYHANETIVKNTCFPLKPDSTISAAKVTKWMDELEAAGLIARYVSDGRKYLWIRKWEKHQRIRAKQRKYPEPPEDLEQMTATDSIGNHLLSNDSKCCQMTADDSGCCQMTTIADNSCRNPIQSESNPNPNQNTRGTAQARFVPPTLEQVREYCQERGSKVDPVKFFDYFSTGGWKDSKGNPVKNWKQKLLTWEAYQPKEEPKKETGNPFLRLLEKEGLTHDTG